MGGDQDQSAGKRDNFFPTKLAIQPFILIILTPGPASDINSYQVVTSELQNIHPIVKWGKDSQTSQTCHQKQKKLGSLLIQVWQTRRQKFLIGFANPKRNHRALMDFS